MTSYAGGQGLAAQRGFCVTLLRRIVVRMPDHPWDEHSEHEEQPEEEEHHFEGPVAAKPNPSKPSARAPSVIFAGTEIA
jgi:hypothetical protein